MVEPTYLSFMFAASFYSTNPEMATIVHKVHDNHPKFFVANYHGVDLLFHRSDSGGFLVIPKPCRWVLLEELNWKSFFLFFFTGHFGVKKVYYLLYRHILWPNILLSCKQAVYYCSIC